MPLVMNLVTQFMGDSRINHFSMVWCNQIETLFQYRSRDLQASRFVYILIALKFGMWVSTHLSLFRAIWYLKHPISRFQVLRGGAYLWFDVWYSVCMNVEYYVSLSWKLVQAKCDYASSIITNRMQDTQFETKIEKAILDSISNQFYFN